MQIKIVLHVLSRALTTDRLLEVSWVDHFVEWHILDHSLILLIAHHAGLSVIGPSTRLLQFLVASRPFSLAMVLWSKLSVVLISPHLYSNYKLYLKFHSRGFGVLGFWGFGFRV